MKNLYKHQEDILRLNPPIYGLWWETGTGKTKASIELAKRNVKTLLVVCPKNLKENWRREIEKWNGGAVFAWRVVSKEELRRDWNKLEPVEGIIVDEAHLGFGSAKSLLSKSLISFCKKHDIQYRWLLTATPIMSSVWSVYSLAVHLGYSMDWHKFKMRFFNDIRMGRRIIPVQKEGIEPDIQKILNQIGGMVKMSDCVDIPEQTFETEYFAMTNQQKKAWESVKDATAIAKWTHRHCIENGVLKSDGYTDDQIFENDKTERILDIADTSKKVAVFCRYNLQIDAVVKALGYRGKKTFVIRGDVKDRDVVVQEANATEDCAIVIQSDCAAGYELPTFHTIVFASLSFSYVNYKQALGRFLRINHMEKNVYIHLVTDAGVDKAVYKCIMDKKDFYIEVFNQ